MTEADSLVTARARRYGRLAARPARVNPLDEFGAAARGLRSLRLKEWIGFTLVHPGCYCSMIMQDAHYLASSEIYLHDRDRNVLHQRAATAPPGALSLPAVLDGSHCVFGRPGYQLEYLFAGGQGTHEIHVAIRPAGGAPGLRGELHLDAGRATAPLSVSSRLPGGRMYTHKAMFPASGWIEAGRTTYTFDPARDLAIIDEHKSFLPYRTTWLWGTFGMHTSGGGLAGANFVSRPELPGEPEESCLWAAGRCEPLADVSFLPDPAGGQASWLMSSGDGRLDVQFRPEGRKQVRHQLGLFAIDYTQLFGTYHGTLRGPDGVSYQVEQAHGVCESMRARL